MKLCFATNNLHKLKEVRELAGSNFEIISLEEAGIFEELPETQITLSGNSFQKAEFVYKKLNIDCFADDTGLEVDALNGEPGVFSARYAGEKKNSNDNMNLLLKKLNGIENRKARFRTIITYINKGNSWQFEGKVEGNIIKEKKGTEGFGYDPVFIPEGYSKTFAEMSLEEKNLLSHRARALEKFIAFLKGMK